MHNDDTQIEYVTNNWILFSYIMCSKKSTTKYKLQILKLYQGFEMN